MQFSPQLSTLALLHVCAEYKSHFQELPYVFFDPSNIALTKLKHFLRFQKVLQIIDNCFLNKNGTRKYKFLVIGKQDTYFVRHHSDSPYKFSEADIKSMLGFLSRQYLCSLWRPGLPTIRWHSYGHKLCSFIGRFILIFI